jgi:tRNA threonylcarbamoyl adenosine modification protein YjeE
MFPSEFVAHSLDDTIALAERVAIIVTENFPDGVTIGLAGDLGAGKTTFVAHLVRFFGSEDEVSSPTYGLMNEYAVMPEPLVIQHWDLYRLHEAPEELFEPVSKQIRLIEWPERCPEIAELIDTSITIFLRPDGSRLFTFAD